MIEGREVARISRWLTVGRGAGKLRYHIGLPVMRELLQVIAVLPFLMLTVSVHEFSHGYVAMKLGDDTAKEKRRLTINPLRHISVPLTIILPAVLILVTRARFSFALLKPVPINPLRFRKPKRGLAWVGMAGPASNIVMGLFFALLLRFNLVPAKGFWGSIREMLAFLVIFNTALALFNLMPIPPLDGSRILVGFLPNKFAKTVLKLDRYGFILILTVFATVALMTGDLIQYVRIPLKAVWKLYGLSGTEFDGLIPPTGTM